MENSAPEKRPSDLGIYYNGTLVMRFTFKKKKNKPFCIRKSTPIRPETKPARSPLQLTGSELGSSSGQSPSFRRPRNLPPHVPTPSPPPLLNTGREPPRPQERRPPCTAPRGSEARPRPRGRAAAPPFCAAGSAPGPPAQDGCGEASQASNGEIRGRTPPPTPRGRSRHF